MKDKVMEDGFSWRKDKEDSQIDACLCSDHSGMEKYSFVASAWNFGPSLYSSCDSVFTIDPTLFMIL